MKEERDREITIGEMGKNCKNVHLVTIVEGNTSQMSEIDLIGRGRVAIVRENTEIGRDREENDNAYVPTYHQIYKEQTHINALNFLENKFFYNVRACNQVKQRLEAEEGVKI